MEVDWYLFLFLRPDLLHRWIDHARRGGRHRHARERVVAVAVKASGLLHLPAHYVESLAVTILPALYTALTVGLVYPLALGSSEVGAWLAAVTYDHACPRMVRDTRIRSAGGNWNTADAAGEIGRTHARFRYKDLSAGPVPQDRWPSFLKFSPGIVLPVKVLTVQHLLFQSQISYVLEYR